MFSNPRYHQRISVSPQDIQPGGNGSYGYIAPIGTDDLCRSKNFASPAILLENDQVMGPGNAPHDEIGTVGGGRFSYNAYTLYFSSSDHSDPRTNGRTYTLILPRPAAPAWLGWILLLILFPFAWLVWTSIQTTHIPIRSLTTPAFLGLVAAYIFLFEIFQNDTLDISAKAALLAHLWLLFGIPAYWLSVLLERFASVRDNFYLQVSILLLVFLATRLPFFYHHPIVGIYADSGTYVRQGFFDSLPAFDIRPPGYLLFVELITRISDRWIVVAGVQSLLALTAGICLIYSVHALRRSLSLPAALALCGFLGSSHVLLYETAAMSESIYTTCLILTFAFLLLAFGKQRARFFFLSSLCMGLLVFIRLSGLYIVVVYALILLYLLWNQQARRLVLGFLLPLPSLLLLWSSYNYFTLGEFGLSANFAHNTGAATAWFWEPDDSLPPEVNAVIREMPSDLKEIGVTDEQLELMRTSWDAEQLFPIFDGIYNPLIKNGWMGARFNNIVSGKSGEAVAAEVIAVSVKKHPELYLKFLWANLVHFYSAVEFRVDFYDFISARSEDFYAADGPYHNPALNGEISKEYYNQRELNFTARPRFEKNALLFLQHLQWRVFHQTFWVIVFFAVFAASVAQLLFTRGKHPGAFVLFAMSITVIGASLVTCLSEPSLERYIYPTQFIYYLAAALAPLLWEKDESQAPGTLPEKLATHP